MFKQGEFFTVGNQILSDKEVSKSDIAVYVAICRFANNDTGVSFVTRNRIQEISRVGRSTITTSLSRLRSKGYLRIDKHVTPSGKVTNKYTVLK